MNKIFSVVSFVISIYLAISIWQPPTEFDLIHVLVGAVIPVCGIISAVVLWRLSDGKVKS